MAESVVKHKSKHLGTFGDACFSFNGNKIITSGWEECLLQIISKLLKKVDI